MIRDADGLIAFVTAREVSGALDHTHRWVTDELAIALAGGEAKKVLEVREASATNQGGIAGDRQHLRYDPENQPASVFMNGASVSQDLLCRSLGRTRAGEVIDLEFGDRIDATGVTGTSAFSYVRYNADLSAQALSREGITDPREQERMRKLDAVASIPRLQEAWSHGRRDHRPRT